MKAAKGIKKPALLLLNNKKKKTKKSKNYLNENIINEYNFIKKEIFINNDKEPQFEENEKKNILNQNDKKKKTHFKKGNYNKYNLINKNLLNILLIIIIIISNASSKEIKIRKLQLYSEITLNIKGRGYQYILNKNFQYLPKEIIINNQNVTNINRSYELNQTNNTILLKWDADIKSCEDMFKDLSNITFINLSNFDSQNVTNMQNMFANCISLESINFGKINTSSVIFMKNMFRGCNLLSNLDLSRFETSKVTNMAAMFKDCLSLNFLNLSSFDTSSVTNMKDMFNGCIRLKSIDINKFNFSSVIEMKKMFYNCSELSSLIFGSFSNSPSLNDTNSMFSECKNLTNLDLSGFDTSNVVDMQNMFKGCGNLGTLNLGKFSIHSVTNMKDMFNGCHNLTSLDLSNFNTSSVYDMSGMFHHCDSLVNLILSNFNTSRVNNMSYMFYNCYNLKFLDLSNFETSRINDMSSMFYNCYNLKFVDLSNFNTSRVNNMSSMFYNCYNLKFLDLSNFETSRINVNNMSSMFYNCSNLKFLDLSNFNTSSVHYMNYMFYHCNSLKSLDLSNFDTSSVRYMNYMFFYCNSLKSLDLSNFDTSSVIDMSGMFDSCHNLKSLYLDNFKTKNITYMNNMFKECESLDFLNLQNFNTKNVVSMKDMFNKCRNLKSLNLNNFDTSKVEDMGWMFYDCNSLTYLNINNFNTLNVTNMEGMFSNCYDLTILDLNNFYTPKVTNMKGMFQNCISLKLINLNNAKTSNVYDVTDMFNKCESLIFLDLKSFDTSNIQKMNATFYNCTSLLYLNLNNFNTSNIISNNDCSNLFDNHNPSLQFCFKEELNNNKCKIPNKNCSHKCFQNKTKFIIEKNSCVDNCFNESIYKYEYNNICYEECPKNTHNSSKNEYLCEDDLICSDYYNYNKTQCIEEIPEGYYCNDSNQKTIDICNSKCKACSLLSVQNNNSCLSCNINQGYYPIYNESLNNNGFINCYKHPLEKYYLENDTFMPCYETCKYCNGLGNRVNHSCYECYSNFTFNDSNCYEICPYYHYFDSQNIYHCTENSSCPKNINKLIINKRKCIEDCNKDDIYKLEYNNLCYQLCPIGTNLTNNTNICINNSNSVFNSSDTLQILNNLTQQYYSTDIQSTIINDLTQQNIINDTVQDITDNFTEYSFQTDSIDTEIIANQKINIKFQNCSNETLLLICEMIKENYNFNNCYQNSLEEYYLLINKTAYNTICSIFKSKIYNNSQNWSIECNNNSFIIYISCFEKKVDKCLYINRKTNICMDECNGNDFFNNICQINPNNSNSIINYKNPLNIQSKDNMIINIEKGINDHSMDSLLNNLTNGDKNDLVINDSDILYQITTSENQKNNEYKDRSTIILGECENILKKHYPIKEGQSFLIFKIDYYMEGSLIPIIGYEIYHPETKEKLNLTYCKEEFVELNIPLSIEENEIFKYDPNNEFYEDKCIPYTTESGTDIIINDRQNEYNENNYSICENNCEFIEYKSDVKKGTCQCDIKSNQLNISELVKKTDILSYDFTKKEGVFNMVSMKCYHILFTKDILKNIGSYILLFTILVFMISGILFYKIGYPLLEGKIRNILNEKEKNQNYNSNNIIETNVKKIKKKSHKKIKNFKASFPPKNGKKVIEIKKEKSTCKRKNKKNKKEIPLNNKVINIKKLNITYNNKKKHKKSFTNLELKSKNLLINPTKSKLKLKDKLINNQKDNYKDFELNSLSYQNALKYDKRKFCDYYSFLIISKQPLFFPFCTWNDYNSFIIKIDLLFLCFSIYYFANALFFDEKIIHEIYLSKGAYDFIYLVPYISYSFIIAHTLFIIIKYFSLSQRNLMEIKKENNYYKAYEKMEKVTRIIIIKYICFFASGTLFLLFLWYYLSSFGAVYRNTQRYLIINTLISFSFGLLFPFIFNFIPGIIRINALQEGNEECLYKFSQFIQII